MTYMRNIKLYHGIDNTIQFTFKNSDSQRVNITGFAVTFNLLSGPEGSIIVSKPATIIDAPFGKVTVTLTELDLIDLQNTYYNYSLIVTDVDNGAQHIVYSDTDYNVRGAIELLSGHYPSFRPSVLVDLPSATRTVITGGTGQMITTTGVIQSDTPTRQQSAHHTAQFYFDNFSGKIDVLATLDSLPNTSSWATVATLVFTEQKLPTYFNWDGVYVGIKFVITPDIILPGPPPIPPAVEPSSGDVTKILYRA